jgi:hypothetical protein
VRGGRGGRGRVGRSPGFSLRGATGNPAGGATCTFEHGLTTCVQSSGFATVGIVNIDDPTCQSGQAEQRTETTTIETTTTVFRGTHQLGEPQTDTTTSTTVTTNCV